MANTRTVNVSRAVAKIDRVKALVGAGLANGNAEPFVAMRKQWEARYSQFVGKRFDDNSVGSGIDGWWPLAVSTIQGRRKGEQGRGATAYAAKEKDAIDKAVASAQSSGRDVQKATQRAIRRVSKAHAGQSRAAAFGFGPDATGRSVRSSLGRNTSAAAKKRAGTDFGELTGVGSGVAVSILKDTGILRNALNIGGVGNLSDAIPMGIVFGFRATPHGGDSATIADIAGWHNKGVPANHLPKRLILAAPNAQTLRGMRGDLQRALDKCVQMAGLAAGVGGGP